MISQLLLRSDYLFCALSATPEIYTLSLHDALPIFARRRDGDLPEAPALRQWGRRSVQHSGSPSPVRAAPSQPRRGWDGARSEEHTSELQSRRDLVCRLLLEKKKLVAREPATSRLGR